MSGPSDTKEGFYAALGVKFCVDVAELKRAYKRQSLRHHPDRNRGAGEATIDFS